MCLESFYGVKIVNNSPPHNIHMYTSMKNKITLRRAIAHDIQYGQKFPYCATYSYL